MCNLSVHWRNSDGLSDALLVQTWKGFKLDQTPENALEDEGKSLPIAGEV